MTILTPRQILQRLPIALPQVKTSSTSENVLIEIRKVKYSLFRAKQVTKKVYSNIMNSVTVSDKNEYYIHKF